jgi:hypothetical protein
MGHGKALVCDKTEIIAVGYRDKKPEVASLSFDKIQRIQIEKYVERKFLRKIPSERILIYTKNSTDPLIISKFKNKDYFEEYKLELTSFAKNNRIGLLVN